MADLRRWITALAILALFAGLASAQITGGGSGGTQLVCSVNTAATPTLRSEGITEQIGDIVITCTGGTLVSPGQLIPQVNITVSLTSQVTSRLLGNFVASPGASEALLMIDEPQSGLGGPIAGYGANAPVRMCGTPNTGCQAWSQQIIAGGATYQVAVNGPSAGSGGTAVAADAAPNTFQGVVSGNQAIFFGVPVDPPGTTASRVFRITNVRTNANGIGGGSASGSIPVQASLLTSNPSALPISNATPIVGFVQSGLTTSVGSPTPFGQCNSQGTSTTVVQATLVSFSENFGTAFKTRVSPQPPANEPTGQSALLTQNIPGTVYNSESGFTLAITGAANPAGLTDFGTRLKAVFNNVPAGVRLWVSLYNVTRDPATGLVTGQVSPPAATSTSSFAQLVTSETISDGSTFPGASAATGVTGTGGVNVVEITPTSGNSTSAVWEVVNTNPNQNETFRFGVFISYVASPGTNSPAAGTGTVNLSYAPTSTVTSASSSAPIPRFIDTSTAKTAITIAICRTVLLFPFLTNQAGFDTGIAISNTSTDPFGTTPQAGTCALNWYGANSVPVYTSPSVATATSYADLVSVRAPNFQGYMIAVCNFQYAHGFAFVSDIGARNLAMGYLALIVPDPSLVPGRNASPFPFAPGNTGEQLGY